MAETRGETFDYVVVGSGAGGGTVAARLAEAGMSVLVLEAGADPAALKAKGLPEDYDAPAFHPFASENEAMAWNFRVHDFGDDAKRKPGVDADGFKGVLYPRCSTLGGCTAHNAMILMAPHDSDWNHIFDITRDPSWRAENMRQYFERIEDCRYLRLSRLLYRLSGGLLNLTGHGWDGWLPTEWPLPRRAFGDHQLFSAIRDAIRANIDGRSKSIFTGAKIGLKNFVDRWAYVVLGRIDPNKRRLGKRFADGLTLVPLSTLGGRRRGTRERLQAAMCKYGLKVAHDALATRILFGDDNRAIGVEYLKGRNLYRAAPNPSDEKGELRQVFARREVILAAGAFNTPQILMLSGVGPPKQLSDIGVAVRVPLEGVGRNLQDRYEVGVIHKSNSQWECLKSVQFTVDDRVYAAWRRGKGMYISNGAAVAFSLSSSVAGAKPDLFVMALLTRFGGYYTGYSNVIRESRKDLTFAVLKAHTENRGGCVRLRSKDPRVPPCIDFHYFEEGTDGEGDDLKAVVEGVTKVRKMAAAIKGHVLAPEDTPGDAALNEDMLKQYIRDHAWGHHASCTCQIGDRNNLGVLDGDFRVHGTRGLRVVDASVFPRIPGFFIVCAIYMIAEKAADAILAAK
jgi:choline dehydrogenase